MMDPAPVHLDFQRHTLDNGLRLILHHQPHLPLVATNLWYHVGSKNEEPGRTGFAHLFEHLLFQGSEHVDTNDHFRLIQQAGGTANGSTWFDRTNYHAVLPSHRLDLGLWLEADRMGFFLPAIDQEKLDNQRDVVMNERRQRIDNQPYGRAFECLLGMLYGEGHPYSWPVIGYMEDLEKANLDDVRRFFRKFYVPNNAVLTLAGDFDPHRVVEQVERYFAAIPGGAPVDQPTPETRIAQTQQHVEQDDVELARIYMGFVVPAYGTEEWLAANLLATVLADGKSSPLYEDLVYERQIAQDVSTYVFPTELTAAFLVIATAVPDTTPEALYAAIGEHLDRYIKNGLAEADLERARNRLLMTHFHQLQTLERRADLLSRATVLFDDPSKATADIEGYMRQTPEDLASVLRRYGSEENRVLLTIEPEENA